MSWKKNAGNKRSPFRFWLYDFIKWTGAWSAWLFFRPRRYFADKKSVKQLKGRGFLLSANHHSYLDPLIIHFALPTRRLYFIAMECLFRTPMLQWFFTHVNCIKVNRENVGLETFREAAQVLREKRVVTIFPEGQINSDVDTENFKEGCAMISQMNRAPILPVYVEPRKSIWNRTCMAIGRPIYPEEVSKNKSGLGAVEELNQILEAREKELVSWFEKERNQKHEHNNH